MPPKHNRRAPWEYAWEYDRALFQRRNAIERLFRRPKGVRRICSRCEQRDVMFVAFLNFALIVEGGELTEHITQDSDRLKELNL